MKWELFKWLRRIATRFSPQESRTMRVPRCGRVVVIDDMVTEADPLIRVLAKHGVPVAYLTGAIDELPASPIPGTRVVFLDIELGVPGQPTRTKISTVMGVVKRIIGPGNGPYVIVAWTKHEDEIEALRAALWSTSPVPMALLDLEKLSYMQHTNEGGTDTALEFKVDAVGAIEARLSSEFEKVGALQVFYAWEDLVHDAASTVTANIHSLVPAGDDWNRNASGILVGLARATAGEQLSVGDPAAVTQNALRTLNSVYVDALESRIASDERLRAVPGLDVTADFKSEEAAGMLNARLLLAEVANSDPPQPGDLFRLRCNEFGILIEEHIKARGSKNGNASTGLSDVRLLVMEVSPPCDYAHDKWKRHRLLPGFLCRCRAGGKSPMKDRADYRWENGPIELDGENWQLVFDLRLLTSRKLDDIPGQRFGRVRRGALADIQARLAYHVSRPGVVSLDAPR